MASDWESLIKEIRKDRISKGLPPDEPTPEEIANSPLGEFYVAGKNKTSLTEAQAKKGAKQKRKAGESVEKEEVLETSNPSDIVDSVEKEKEVPEKELSPKAKPKAKAKAKAKVKAKAKAVPEPATRVKAKAVPEPATRVKAQAHEDSTPVVVEADDIKPLTSDQLKGLDLFVEHGRAIRETWTSKEKRVEGTLSNSLEFVCALGDPRHAKGRIEKGENKTSYWVVGYVFRATRDVEVPNIPLSTKGKRSVLNVDFENLKMEKVKKGEMVTLRLMDAAYLASKKEYGGKFTGGPEEMHVSLSAKMRKAHGGEPRPYLIISKGSIKSGMRLIADIEQGKGRKRYKLKEEYAPKFKELFNLSQGSAAAKSNDERQSNLAAAMQNYFNKRIK